MCFFGGVVEGELGAEGETGEDKLFVGFPGVVAAAAAVMGDGAGVLEVVPGLAEVVMLGC